jgi:hypothetical protein
MPLNNANLLSQAWKQPSLQDFLTKTKIMACLGPNLNHETKYEKKNTTRVKQKSNKILLQGINKNKRRLWEENIHKISVEHIKSN